MIQHHIKNFLNIRYIINMYYIVQQNLFREEGHTKLLKCLEKFGINYELVDVLPFYEEIEFETDRKDVFCFGSLKMARLSKKYGWEPGAVITENHDYEVYSKQQLTANTGIKKKGDFVLKCTSSGIIGIPSKQAYGYWEVQIMSNGLNNKGIVFMANTPYTNEPYVLALASGGIIILRSTGGGTIMQTNGDYIDNTVMYKIRIYRTGGSTPTKFPLKLVPAGTVQSTGTFLVTIQGGIYTNETIVSTTGGTPSNPNTENGSTSCKYFNLSLTTNDIIGDIIMKDGWTG